MTIDQARDRLRQRPSVPLFAAEAPWDADLDRALREETPEALFAGRQIRDPKMAAAVISGLLIWNDNFDSSHNICQGLDNPTGSYWHMICHRREGQRGRGLEANLQNTRHWVRQTGAHPAFPAVQEQAVAALEAVGGGFRWATETAGRLRAAGGWQPSAMVDWFGEADAGALSPQTRELLEEMQRREIETLLAWCLEQAL